MFKSLRMSMAVSFMLCLSSAADAENQCIGVRCSLSNMCEKTGGDTERPCCCQPQCGPEGCYACIQSCLWPCTGEFCPPSPCSHPSWSGPMLANGGFSLSEALMRSASDGHIVVGMILRARSMNLTVPVYSQVVAGGTSVFGEQVGFRANVHAEPTRIAVELVFEHMDAKAAPLPGNIRFEMDQNGNASVSRLSPAALRAFDEAIADGRAACEARRLAGLVLPASLLGIRAR